MANISILGYNIGTDASLTITDQFGDIFIESDLGLLTDLNARQTTIKLKVTPISNGGVPVFQTLPNGWSGSMMFTRFGPSFQQIFLDAEAAYYGFGIIPVYAATLSIRNRDGSVDEVLFGGMQLDDADIGHFRATKEVDMRMNFVAATCQGMGAAVAFLAGLAQAA